MRSPAIPMMVVGPLLLVVAMLSVAGIIHVRNHGVASSAIFAAARSADLPPCNGLQGSASAQPGPHPHSVTLSWNAAVPASSSALDTIKGYYVYRSVESQTYSESNRLSQSVLAGTRCVDTTVEAQKTYFYVVEAIAAGGKRSGFSVEVKAVVPSP